MRTFLVGKDGAMPGKYDQEIKAGWECSLSKETAFVERAIRQATALRHRQGRPLAGGTIYHSGAGSQYTSVRFGETLQLARMIPSIGTVGTPTTMPWPKRRWASTKPNALAATRPSA
jgi:hypothetical protein